VRNALAVSWHPLELRIGNDFPSFQ
jgi:hypothetical protein